VEPELTVEDPNFNDEFGGYQAIDESPAFGDDALMASADSSEEEFNDPMLSDSNVESVIRDLNAGHYHLRAVWGRLRFDSTSTTPTDWSGSLSSNYGVEILRRVIRFEPGQDYILPRKDRRTIEWVSKTTVHHDGIAVDIFVPPVIPVLDTTRMEMTDSLGNVHIEIVVDTTWPARDPVMVQFKTGPYSRGFNLEELVSLDTIVFLDDSNAVAFHAFKLDRLVCPKGFLSGVWGFDDSGKGIFRGVWMDRMGRVDGFLKGHFGRTEDGRELFFGKWVSREGRFEGFIRGHWGYYNCISNNITTPCSPAGHFDGHIYSSNRVIIGVLGGQFRIGFPSSVVAGGFFQGRWKLYCPDETVIEGNAEEGFE
jgi:hypothetical protein